MQFARQLSYWRGITESGGKLAQAYEHQGNLTAGLAAVNEALEANKHIPDELYFAPRNLGIKAEIEAKLGHNKQAENLYRKSADVIDGMLMNVPTPNIERTLISELGNVYAGNFKLASDEGDYAKAFQIIEKARGRVEAQSLANHSVLTPHDPTATEKKLNALQLELLDTDEAQQRKRILDEIYQTEVQQVGTASIGSQSLIEPVTIDKLQANWDTMSCWLSMSFKAQNPTRWLLPKIQFTGIHSRRKTLLNHKLRPIGRVFTTRRKTMQRPNTSLMSCWP